jgi:hypothetical protein
VNFQAWYNKSLGQPIDIDQAFGDQCVDVAMSWAEYCFPGHKWPELLGYGDAKDLYAAANAAFFDKLQNIVPQQGDMAIFGATSTNPYGHIAVVINGYQNAMNVIEQNGFNPSGVAYLAQRPYSNVIGYLRPKGVKVLTKEQIIMIHKLAFDGKEPGPGLVDGWVGKNLDDFVNALWNDPTYQAWSTKVLGAVANSGDMEANALGKALIKLIQSFGYKKG